MPFRMFARNPGFTAIVVLTLALGIGANTAIFSLIDALMLRWLPVRNPQELVQVTFHAAWPGGPAGGTLLVCDRPRARRSARDLRGRRGLQQLQLRRRRARFGQSRPRRHGHRRLLRDTRPDPGARPSAHARGRRARRAAGGGHQLRLLGAPVRAQPRRGRPDAARSTAFPSRSSASVLADSSAPTSDRSPTSRWRRPRFRR